MDSRHVAPLPPRRTTSTLPSKLLLSLHREFLNAGSQVLQALTFFGTEAGLPAVATMSFRPLITRCSDDRTPADCAKVMTDLGAIAVGANCEQDPPRMLSLLREMRGATHLPLAAQPAAFRTSDTCHSFTRLPAFPDDLETIQVSRTEFRDFGRVAGAEGIRYLGGCCGCNAAYIRALAAGCRGAMT